MFPYAHICFARDILGRLTNEIVLGAVFPDTVIAGYIKHADTHGRCGEIYAHLGRADVFRDFAAAAVTHGTTPEGLDYYCDEKYRDYESGYAFEMARSLVDKVVKCCRLPDKMGWWKAHNFIEMAADVWLYRHCRDDYGYLAEALNDRALIKTVSETLAAFYDLPADKIATGFPVYAEYVLMDEVTPLELAKKYGKQTLMKHDLRIDIPGAANVIEEALAIINRTFPEFLNTCGQKVGKLIETLNNQGHSKAPF